MACKKCGETLPEDLGATYQKRSICRECYSLHYRKVNMSDDPICRACAEPLTDPYPNQGYICRKCYLHVCNERIKRKRGGAQEADGEVEDDPLPFEITEVFVPQKKDDLYVMSNPRIPDEKKVGRSQDPTQRAKELQRSQNFRMVIHKTYHCQGHLEATVHKRLKARKVTEGDGQEWFKVDLETLDMIIMGVIAESQLL